MYRGREAYERLAARPSCSRCGRSSAPRTSSSGSCRETASCCSGELVVRGKASGVEIAHAVRRRSPDAARRTGGPARRLSRDHAERRSTAAGLRRRPGRAAYAMLRQMPRRRSTDLTLGEAAREIGVSVDTLRRWERSGKLRAVRDERNRRRVPRREVERLAATPAPPPGRATRCRRATGSPGRSSRSRPTA